MKIHYGITLISFLFLAACTGQTENTENTALEAPSYSEVLAGAQRSDDNRARDRYRHPRQTLEFFGLQRSDTVVEIWPGGGWYTEVLSPLLNAGTLYAAHFDENANSEYYRNSRKAFIQKLDGDAVLYENVELTVLAAPELTDIAHGAKVDKVLTFRNVHNWMRNESEQAVFAAMYAALKPGGILGVVEHRAKVGASKAEMISSGYVTEAYVIALAEQAGFRLLASSEVNANDLDTTQHPKGVWTLPPSLRLGETDKVQYQAIGESDRMTLKFQKPE
jgi:predicted methyltransferase